MFVWSAQQAELFANRLSDWKGFARRQRNLLRRVDFSSAAGRRFSFSWHMLLRGTKRWHGSSNTHRENQTFRSLIDRESHRTTTTDRVERRGWIRDDTCRREREREKSSSWSRESDSLLFVFWYLSLSRFLSSLLTPVKSCKIHANTRPSVY